MSAKAVFLRVSGGDEDIVGSQGASTSGGSDTVGEDLVTDLLELGVGEDETDVAYAAVNVMFRSCADGEGAPLT